MAGTEIPIIDPNVKHIGVSKLRGLNATKLKEGNLTFVIQENDNPLAVLVSYEKYLIIQEQFLSVMNTMEMLADGSDLDGVKAGLDDLRNNRTHTLADVRKELGRKR